MRNPNDPNPKPKGPSPKTVYSSSLTLALPFFPYLYFLFVRPNTFSALSIPILPPGGIRYKLSTNYPKEETKPKPTSPQANSDEKNNEGLMVCVYI